MKKLIILSFVLFFAKLGHSQTCGTCTVNVTTLDSASYTINTGQILCVDTTGNFIGTVTLNGGTVCNKGLFNPKIINLTSGTVSNYSNASFKSALSIGSSIQLINNADAIMSIAGNLTVGGGTVTNSGIININQVLQNNSGSLTNSSVINCSQMTGNGPLNNTGVINAN
jgi:hypothetical protein